MIKNHSSEEWFFILPWNGFLYFPNLLCPYSCIKFPLGLSFANRKAISTALMLLPSAGACTTPDGKT